MKKKFSLITSFCVFLFYFFITNFQVYANPQMPINTPKPMREEALRYASSIVEGLIEGARSELKNRDILRELIHTLLGDGRHYNLQNIENMGDAAKPILQNALASLRAHMQNETINQIAKDRAEELIAHWKRELSSENFDKFIRKLWGYPETLSPRRRNPIPRVSTLIEWTKNSLSSHFSAATRAKLIHMPPLWSSIADDILASAIRPFFKKAYNHIANTSLWLFAWLEARVQDAGRQVHDSEVLRGGNNQQGRTNEIKQLAERAKDLQKKRLARFFKLAIKLSKVAAALPLINTLFFIDCLADENGKAKTITTSCISERLFNITTVLSSTNAHAATRDRDQKASDRESLFTLLVQKSTFIWKTSEDSIPLYILGNPIFFPIYQAFTYQPKTQYEFGDQQVLELLQDPVYHYETFYALQRMANNPNPTQEKALRILNSYKSSKKDEHA